MVIGRSGRGYTAHIGFDLDNPMGSSTCVSCGECMVSCPTGALTNKRVIGQELGGGDKLDAEWILQLPVFKGVSGTFLELNQDAVVKRRFTAGRDHLPRGRVRIDRLLHSRGDGRGLHRHADQARAAGRRAGRLVQHHPQQAVEPRGAHALGRKRAPLHPDRRAGRPALRQSDRRARRRRSVRRDDLHELPSAVGDRPREDGSGRAGNAAQRARHPAAEQDVPRRARSQVPRARARNPPQERPGVRLDAAGLHRPTCATGSS